MTKIARLIIVCPFKILIWWQQKINDDDLNTLNKFLNYNVASDVVDGLKDAKEEVAANIGVGNMADVDLPLTKDFEAHLNTLRELMKNYKKGRIFPKLIKVLPQIQDWNYIMEKLDFNSWTPSAIRLMTDQFKAKGGEGVKL